MASNGRILELAVTDPNMVNGTIPGAHTEFADISLQCRSRCTGTGYDPSLRILGDWGSTLYIIEEMEANT